MTKYWDPPLFSPKIFFYQNDSEWPKMDFKHNFKNLRGGPSDFGSFSQIFLFLFFSFKHGLNHPEMQRIFFSTPFGRVDGRVGTPTFGGRYP